MAKQTDSTAPPRTPLNKERVLRAAVALADESGIETLTMRRLARELGVEAMSLYNHVANKDEILDGIVDAVVSEIELPSDEVDWKTAVRHSSIARRDAYLQHKWACSLSMSRQSGGPARLRYADWLLRRLREAGFAKDVIYHAFHILEAYVLGFTIQQLSFEYTEQELADLAGSFLQQLPAGAYPDFVEHVEQHLEPRHDDEGGFERGLDLILDGLERASR